MIVPREAVAELRKLMVVGAIVVFMLFLYLARNQSMVELSRRR